MENPSFLQETKQHGAVRFPFNIYPCTIPGDFPQVALHWQDSMELVFVKRGSGLVQMGTATYPAHTGDIFVFSPGTLHALRQKEGCSMEYENIIFDLELLGGAGDLCAEKYLLPLQSGRLSLTQRLTPDEPCYARAAACLRETEDVNRAKEPGYELFIKGALLRFLALLIAQGKNLPPMETADSRRLKKILQWVAEHYGEEVHISDVAQLVPCSESGRFKDGFRVGGEPGFYFPQGKDHIKGQTVRRGVEVQGIVGGGHGVNLFSCFVICPAECWAVGRGRFVRCGPARASGFVSGVELVAAAGADEAEPGSGDLLADRFGPAGALGFPAQVLQCPLLTDDLAGLLKDVVKLLHDFVLLSYHANRRLHTCCISSFAFIGAMSTETAAFFGSTVSVARMGANGLLLLW